MDRRAGPECPEGLRLRFQAVALSHLEGRRTGSPAVQGKILLPQIRFRQVLPFWGEISAKICVNLLKISVHRWRGCP